MGLDGLSTEHRREFVNGKLWPDTNGVHINAGGGGFLWHEGRYYWFGEHKTGGETTYASMLGVHAYSSPDLYNWTDEGMVLRADNQQDSDMVRRAERPKAVYNALTGKFVMWFHIEHVHADGPINRCACSGVAVSDCVTGPYLFAKADRPDARTWPENVFDDWKRPLADYDRETLERIQFHGGQNSLYPMHALFRKDHDGGQMARDMTVFVDDDGAAYHVYSSEENGTLHISELTSDYLGHSGRYVRVFPGGFHEAPALFKRHGRYYLITSDCTGWWHNPARSAVADSIWGPWRELGNPCKGTSEQVSTTFGSQGTYVLPVFGKPDAYIYMGDRWNPANAIDGRYIWLPLFFDGDRPRLEWRARWDLSVFD